MKLNIVLSGPFRWYTIDLHFLPHVSMLNFGSEDRRYNRNGDRPEVVNISWKESLDCARLQCRQVGLEVGSRDPADGDRLGKAWSSLPRASVQS